MQNGNDENCNRACQRIECSMVKGSEISERYEKLAVKEILSFSPEYNTLILLQRFFVVTTIFLKISLSIFIANTRYDSSFNFLAIKGRA